MSYLYDMVSSRIFLAAFCSWFMAQFIKAIIDQLRTHPRSSRDLFATLFWRTGGMPSSHSSMVTALATSIAILYGVRSPIFAMSLFYGMLIIRDAMGVRRSAGLQAQALNRLGRQLSEKYGVQFEPVKEVSGHTPSEVSVGILLGFFIGVAFSIL